ncbi:hypothetical protein JCM8547_008474 [Rhodosporidiobolus lusitaniae]
MLRTSLLVAALAVVSVNGVTVSAVSDDSSPTPAVIVSASDASASSAASASDASASGSSTASAADSSASATPVSASRKVASDDWNYKGCYNGYSYDGARTITNLVTVPASLTSDGKTWKADLCLEAVKQKGYAVGGVTYGGECWGSYTVPESTFAQDADQCEWACSDNDALDCGGKSSIDVYIATSYNKVIEDENWSYKGCFTDSISKRTIANLVHADKWSVKSCLAAVKASRYSVGGLEYGGECWGGYELANTGSQVDVDECSFGCNDQGDVSCGAENRLDVYTLKTAKTKVRDNEDWTYAGCYSDSPRALGNLVTVPGSKTWSAEKCLAAVTEAGYKYGGIIYGGECWGANSNKGSALEATRCGWPCADDQTTTCGGESGLDVYIASSSAAALRKHRRSHNA